MAYKVQKWENGSPQTPLSAGRLTYMETGIETAHITADAAAVSAEAVGSRVGILEQANSGLDQKIDTKVATAVGEIELPTVNPETIQQAVAAELEKHPPSEVDLTPVNTRLDALDGEEETSLKSRVTVLEQRPVGETVDLKPLTDRVTALENKPTTGGGKVLSAMEKYFDPTKRYFAPVTYWWADQRYNPKSNWHALFTNIDLMAFAIINPGSGAGIEKNDDFEALMTSVKNAGRPACVYVRTVTDLAARTMRPTEDIKAELLKYHEFYGDLVTGVFYDETYNGWDEQYADQQAVYEELARWAKAEFGNDFLVVFNPGSPVNKNMANIPDVMMTFENMPARYLGTESNLNPDWFKIHPATMHWHAVHDVENEQQAREILAKADVSNVAHIYLTDDKFTGVIGSESPDNNPWDNLPSPWLIRLQVDWCRRALLPESVCKYSEVYAAE